MTSLFAPPARTGLGARLRLARRILAIHYVQPATALWRLFEVEVVLEHLRGRGRGLDLGCGDGTLATVLLSRTPDIRWTGLDVDPRDAGWAHRRGLYEHIHVASASAIPERDRAFDLVFSNSALEHMDGLDAVLGEVRRVLRPGGRFVFTVPEPGFHASLFWPRFLRRLGGREAAARYVRHLDRRVAHVNYLSPEQWLERLSRHDLQGDLVVPYLSKRAVGWWETLANATGGLAYLAAGERMTPRQIQQASGLLEREHPSLGTVAFVALLPVLLLTASERHPRRFGCLYVEATRRA